MLLDKRIVVITGAARGLGRAFAQACAAAGAELVLADREVALGERTAQAIAATGAKVTFLPIDLADPVSVERFADALAERFERIDGLVNNAALATGIGGKFFSDIAIEEWDLTMAINVRGPWLTIRALTPLLLRSGNGKIVNIASDTALWGAPRLLHYISSKGAIVAMTRGLARELGPEGISVNALAPGLVKTESTDYVPAERHRLYERGRAMPRVQLPEDCTASVVFLLSSGADFITGQILPVNGGFVFN